MSGSKSCLDCIHKAVLADEEPCKECMGHRKQLGWHPHFKKAEGQDDE